MQCVLFLSRSRCVHAPSMCSATLYRDLIWFCFSFVHLFVHNRKSLFLANNAGHRLCVCVYVCFGENKKLQPKRFKRIAYTELNRASISDSMAVRHTGTLPLYRAHLVSLPHDNDQSKRNRAKTINIGKQSRKQYITFLIIWNADCCFCWRCCCCCSFCCWFRVRLVQFQLPPPLLLLLLLLHVRELSVHVTEWRRMRARTNNQIHREKWTRRTLCRNYHLKMVVVVVVVLLLIQCRSIRFWCFTCSNIVKRAKEWMNKNARIVLKYCASQEFWDERQMRGGKSNNY